MNVFKYYQHYKIKKEKSSLHYLLPIKRDLNAVNRLRHAKTFNYHRHEPRDLEDRLFHTVLLITNCSYVISCLIFNLFTACYFLALFIHYSVQSSYCCNTK